MYVNKCTKCGKEFETKNPKRVICPDCLYPERKEGTEESNQQPQQQFYSSYSSSNETDERQSAGRYNDRYSQGGYSQNNDRYSQGGYSQGSRYDRAGNYSQGQRRGGYSQNNDRYSQGGYSQGSRYDRAGNYSQGQRRGGYSQNNDRYSQGGYSQGSRYDRAGNYSQGQRRGGFSQNNDRYPQGGYSQGSRRPSFSRPRRPQAPRARQPQKTLLINREQLEQIELLYKQMLPLPNPDAHEVIGEKIGLEPRKVFFGINLVRQKMMLPKLPYPKRKLAISPDQMLAIQSLYEPLLPLPPIGCHKIIAAQLKMDEWRVHVGIGLIRAKLGLDRWNPNRPDAPEEFKVIASDEKEEKKEVKEKNTRTKKTEKPKKTEEKSEEEKPEEVKKTRTRKTKEE